MQESHLLSNQLSYKPENMNLKIEIKEKQKQVQDVVFVCMF